MTSQAKTSESDTNTKHKQSPEKLVETTPPATKPKSDDHPKTVPPSFHGNFDLYAMELPFIRSKFTPECDYAALLKVLRYHQTRPDSSAQIYLPDDFSTGIPGRLRSLPIKDPLEGMPHRLVLTSLALHDSVAFTARETTEDALYSVPPTSAAAATPGVTATVSLVDHRCGAFITMAMAEGEGTFKMRRAWVSADGKDEIFEGFFSLHIGYASTCICGAIDDDDNVVEALDVYMPFWGIRARVGPDGREVGLGTTGGDDENMEMRNLRLMLAGAGLKRAL
ncbi:hypothetical protein V8D89_014366 [Ganoderma adspersum]